MQGKIAVSRPQSWRANETEIFFVNAFNGPSNEDRESTDRRRLWLPSTPRIGEAGSRSSTTQ
ncbi:hypothetical protein NE852_23265 [Rhizobium sp. Pop5]|uniref:hypothetical protein n=1 Tax=Rhizobium sp. Pop5 TaxID=1223565 RepID=UPI000283859A|nr:hypothetical protein [Rhizobium sp. Pop5]EJZ22080.1 hypothetical protein RCCGEPOP_06601 [Rhizobium sp. Pop5]UVD56933.1 hypothetical protein NE852_23265 [Rhizobium sp. Pop5]